ncbi:MAG: carboxypeptidase-like regulatory domain-containing protein, partial [Cyclobacteriaceae bacterium]|nr:carboxypeptidase-like regulatory domain-containing protein [Cyclobacteriaceae bacterium]
MKIINLLFPLILLFSIIFLNTADAQKGVISGEIIDSQSNEKVPFASIALFQQDYSNTVKGVVSDENGKFNLHKIPYGNYNLIISFMGYNSDTLGAISLNQQNSEVDLGVLSLAQSVINLESVEIRGLSRTVSTEMDRRTYNANDFETAKGG